MSLHRPHRAVEELAGIDRAVRVLDARSRCDRGPEARRRSVHGRVGRPSKRRRDLRETECGQFSCKMRYQSTRRHDAAMTTGPHEVDLFDTSDLADSGDDVGDANRARASRLPSAPKRAINQPARRGLHASFDGVDRGEHQDCPLNLTSGGTCSLNQHVDGGRCEIQSASRGERLHKCTAGGKVWFADFHHHPGKESAHERRAHASDLARVRIGGKHDLSAEVADRIDGVQTLGLRRGLVSEEMHIVNHEQIQASHPLPMGLD